MNKKEILKYTRNFIVTCSIRGMTLEVIRPYWLHERPIFFGAVLGVVSVPIAALFTILQLKEKKINNIDELPIILISITLPWLMLSLTNKKLNPNLLVYNF